MDGTKVWTTNAHLNHFFVILCRTSAAEDRHAGLSQLIVDLSSPGVSVSPIPLLDGELHVNEVVLDGVHVPDERVLGEVGQGWAQVTAELAHERSGPDRYLSVLGPAAGVPRRARRRTSTTTAAAAFGRIAARLWSIRQLSLSVARSLEQGEAPATEAALVKDVGTVFEQEAVETMREIAGLEIDPEAASLFERLLAECVLNAPSWTLRGGTTEVLRGIAAKALTRESRRGGSTDERPGDRDGRAARRGRRRPARPVHPRGARGGRARRLGARGVGPARARAGSPTVSVPGGRRAVPAGRWPRPARCSRRSVRRAAPVPVAETGLLAGRLLAAAGLDLPGRRGVHGGVAGR